MPQFTKDRVWPRFLDGRDMSKFHESREVPSMALFFSDESLHRVEVRGVVCPFTVDLGALCKMETFGAFAKLEALN